MRSSGPLVVPGPTVKARQDVALVRGSRANFGVVVRRHGRY
jgi:hypothetical protein